MLYASRFLRVMNPLMDGPDVKAVQVSLTKLGYYKGSVNSKFDQSTADAVKSFQRAVGLRVDGIVGPDTWNALGLSVGTVNINREYRIVIDTVRINLSLYRGGNIQNTYSVSVGKPNTPTPIGDWIIIDKEVNPGGPFGVRWMRLNVPWGGYGIHGTDNPSSIGSASSHGCIRLLNEEVIKLFDTVQLGTQVKITGQAYTGRLLKIGIEPGSDVVSVQQRLQIFRYYQGEIDGIYGNQTRDAVIAFQADRGLSPDGIVGPRTYEELEKAYDVALGLRTP
jgi:L,D-transpeptidase ErfK/SrfK